jgi:DNA-binding protein WhiA
VRAEKETRNYVNRTNNCVYANLDKLVAAAMRQQQAVNTIIRHGHFQRLPKALKEAAELRINYPDAGLQELADMAGIKKSGMNHRLARLVEYAQDLENGLL